LGEARRTRAAVHALALEARRIAVPWVAVPDQAEGPGSGRVRASSSAVCFEHSAAAFGFAGAD
tara:strand:- start:28083 stop:28271 length:189 start_codon:yes stop_codon:yes gene_type:complete